MAIVSIIVLILAFFNPPQIFWIMYFGGTVIASAWGVAPWCQAPLNFYKRINTYRQIIASHVE